LTVLLVALAVLMVAAFSLGYGAARSVRAARSGPAVEGSPTPVVMTEVVLDPTVPEPRPSPSPPAATATARPVPPTVVPPTGAPATATPKSKPTVQPRPTEKPAEGFWVQVMASSKEDTIGEARTKLVGLGFDLDHHQVVHSEVAGGNELIKLRVGPFPDRDSADRVLQRMRGAGFPDAWVVVP
jgi:cell division septation protein DedD